MNSSDSGDDLDQCDYHAADPFSFDDPFYDQTNDDSKGMVLQLQEELKSIRSSPIFYWNRQRIVDWKN